MFFWELLKSLFWVMLFGGFLSYGYKLYEWIDDRYLDSMIGKWLQKQPYMFLRIYPPTENTRSVSEMEQFFVNLCAIHSKKNLKEMYTQGKFYENFTFEFHSKGGQVAIFLHTNRNYVPLIRSSLEAHFPGTTIVECPDPFTGWPKQWTKKGFSVYTDLYGSELEIMPSAKIDSDLTDLHPIKSWKTFQTGNMAPINDPVTQLYTALENLNADNYAVIQFVIRPFNPNDDGTIPKWEAELERLRKEFMTNGAIELDENGKASYLTEEEKYILNEARAKIRAENAKVKTRFIIMGGESKPKLFVPVIMSYFRQYKTAMVYLHPHKDSKTSEDDGGELFGAFGPWWGAFVDKIYWEREQHVRKKRIYEAVIKRSMMRGLKPKYYSCESLAALIHFPITTDRDPSVVKRVSSEYGNTTNLLTVGQPPVNLPT